MRTCVFIDGANFYYGLRDISRKFTDLRFDFDKYIKFIIDDVDDLVNVFYYNAPIKNFGGKNKLYAKQQRFFKRLEKTDKFKVHLCKRQRRLSGLNKEYHIIKGDDIHLATDLVRCVCEDICDKVILISGDGDFEPAIRLAKEKNKIVDLAYFEESISKNILKMIDRSFLIDEKICRKYFYRER